MRKGFTTGSCAAAAAKAAAYMLFLKEELNSISIMTPGGVEYRADIYDINRESDSVSCAVKKDAGDDPDITNGLMVYAKVSLCADASYNGIPSEAYEALSSDKDGEPYEAISKDESSCIGISIKGGKGIGRVTRPGLDQPVGSFAINSVPRRMIDSEVRAVATLAGYKGCIDVEISIPEGERIAAKTFNPRLGIEGGISVIGTSGIVEPMSTKALIDTIRLELKQRMESGYDYAVIVPGNYGRDLVYEHFGYDIDRSVRCSNYIGETFDMAYEMGFKRLLLVGHIGKLIKVAGGIMNTHSREADCRMEILTSIALLKGADVSLCKDIMECAATEEAVSLIASEGILKPVMDEVTERIVRYISSRMERDPIHTSADTDIPAVDCVVFDNVTGILGMSKGMDEWRDILNREMK